MPVNPARPVAVFSWKALLLAPLAIPVLYSAAFVAADPGPHPVAGFLFFCAIGCVICYGSTAFLLLPCLLALSRSAGVTVPRAALVGLLLGAAVWFPVAWQSWCAGGANSGPPTETFLQHVVRQGFDVDTWAFPLGGLVTSALYALLARKTARSKR